MAKEFAKKFYRSKEWIKCRKSYIDSVYGLCERCKEPGKILHHKKHLTINNIDNPFITLSHSNLEFLCLECHNKHHNFDREKLKCTRDGLAFNEKGELEQLSKPPLISEN